MMKIKDKETDFITTSINDASYLGLCFQNHKYGCEARVYIKSCLGGFVRDDVGKKYRLEFLTCRCPVETEFVYWVDKLIKELEFIKQQSSCCFNVWKEEEKARRASK